MSSATSVAATSSSMRFAMSYGHTSLDPHRTPHVSKDVVWCRPLYDNLLRGVPRDGGGVDLAPQLAASFEVSDDARELRFTLREGVRFHDGTPFDARAVEANIARAQAEGSTVAGELAAVTRVEVVDPHHVVIHLREPDPTVLWALAESSAGMMVSPAAFESDLNARPVGTGPFTLVSAQHDSHDHAIPGTTEVVYQRYPEYWDSSAASLQSLTIVTVGDSEERFDGVLSGAYDAAHLAPPHDTRIAAREGRDLISDGFQYRAVVGANDFLVYLNTSMPPLDDVRVRRALWLGLDRQAIADGVLGGATGPSFQVFGKGFEGYDESLNHDPFDPDEARRLVREAGAEGQIVEIMWSTNEEEIVTAIRDQLAQNTGLDVRTVAIHPSELGVSMGRGAHHAMMSMAVAEPDPGRTLLLTYFPNARNPNEPEREVRELALTARTLPPGAEREAAYRAINRHLVDRPMHLNVAQYLHVILARPRVTGTENLMTYSIQLLDFRNVGVQDEEVGA